MCVCTSDDKEEEEEEEETEPEDMEAAGQVQSWLSEAWCQSFITPWPAKRQEEEETWVPILQNQSQTWK